MRQLIHFLAGSPRWIEAGADCAVLMTTASNHRAHGQQDAATAVLSRAADGLVPGLIDLDCEINGKLRGIGRLASPCDFSFLPFCPILWGACLCGCVHLALLRAVRTRWIIAFWEIVLGQ